ncbi:MAG: hypothetical protein K2X47_04785, partial [Bdellovibrionales bacterium]|nr:hypothetical protein [Bdellovibrionales bacterium]
MKSKALLLIIPLSLLAAISARAGQLTTLDLSCSTISVGAAPPSPAISKTLAPQTVIDLKVEKAKQEQRDQAQILQHRTVYLQMFVDAFNTEFGKIMVDTYRDIFDKLLFAPDSLTDADYTFFRNGVFARVREGNENIQASPLKYFIGFNHITDEQNTEIAEGLLYKLRKPADGKPFKLTQLEAVTLRFAKIIGRDFDLLRGSRYELSERAVKKMKYRFLSLFSFAQKQLSKEELEAFYDAKLIVDDPMDETRYEIAQKHPHDIITSEMILGRNREKIRETHDHESGYRKAQLNGVRSGKERQNAYGRFLAEIDLNSDLRASLQELRKHHLDIRTGNQLLKIISMEGDAFERALLFISSPVYREHHASVLLLMEKERKLKTFQRLLTGKPAWLQKFFSTSEGERVFYAMRALFKTNPNVDLLKLEQDLEKKRLHYETLLTFIQNHKTPAEIAQIIAETRLIRSALTAAEVNDVFKVLTYSSEIRLADLIKYDPTSKFGFCFGRAFFGNILLQKWGVHPESIKKAFLYGPMSGGLFGWGFHVAVMVAREGGGFWVLDPSHGKVETL